MIRTCNLRVIKCISKIQINIRCIKIHDTLLVNFVIIEKSVPKRRKSKTLNLINRKVSCYIIILCKVNEGNMMRFLQLASLSFLQKSLANYSRNAGNCHYHPSERHINNKVNVSISLQK